MRIRHLGMTPLVHPEAYVAPTAVLAWIALRPLQVGFAIMEVTWTIVSLVALARVLRSRPSRVG